LLKRIPIKPEGWAVIVGVFILGLLLGALIAPNYERPRLVFNQASAGDAIRDAALQARHCFARPVPALVGSVEAEFAPSGEVAQLNIGGGLLHVDEHRCIQDAFSAMHVPPFDGEPVKAKKTVSLSLDP
jgi:hypothetical protein